MQKFNHTTVIAASFMLAASVLVGNNTSAEGRDGKSVYNSACAACHSVGLANAPKPHDVAAWKSKNKTVDELVQSAIKGLNVMPPRGACGDCSDAEIKAGIEFMSQPK